MRITSLDHLVLTVGDIAVTIRWYQTVLGMEPVTFGNNRRALAFGAQKINLHQVGKEFEPKAAHPTPGSADLCFLTDTPISDIIAHCAELAQPIIEGPVPRTGAMGPLFSIYLRDPDGNLIEIANPHP